MTGADFLAYCKRVFKRTDKDTEFFEVLTDVIMDIKLRFEWEDFKEEAYSTGISTLGDYKFTLPSDFGHLIGDVVWRESYTNSRPLKKLSKARYDELYPYPSSSDYSTGVPQYYCIYGGEIFIGPPPDQTDYTYLINYTTESATAITTDTASVPFTDKYRWVIRDVVLGEFYDAYLGQPDRAERYRQKGEIGIQKMVANENNDISAPSFIAYQDV